jgi:CheY-like chemotaxis protein
MAASLRLDVLLADDDDNDVILIRRALKSLGWLGRLTPVQDGDQVLDYLQGEGIYSNRREWPLPSVLLLDYWMPRISGIDVLFWIRTEPKFVKLPVVLLSGGLPPVQATLLSRLQAAYCTKSSDLKETARSIQHAVTRALALARGAGQPRRRASPASEFIDRSTALPTFRELS